MIRFRDLTPNDIALISDGCGILARGLKVPDFIFRASCDQHDFYTVRGTGWSWNSHWFLLYSIVRWYLQGEWYLQKANAQFWYFMCLDALNERNQFLEKVLYLLLATVYWFAVSLWALFPRTRTMTEWRTKEEIFEYVREYNNINENNS